MISHLTVRQQVESGMYAKLGRTTGRRERLAEKDEFAGYLRQTGQLPTSLRQEACDRTPTFSQVVGCPAKSLSQITLQERDAPAAGTRIMCVIPGTKVPDVPGSLSMYVLTFVVGPVSPSQAFLHAVLRLVTCSTLAVSG